MNAKKEKVKHARKITESIDRKVKKCKELKKYKASKDPNAPKGIPDSLDEFVVSDSELQSINSACSADTLDALLGELTTIEQQRASRGQKNKCLISHVSKVSKLAQVFCRDMADSLTTCEYQPNVRGRTANKILKDARSGHFSHVMFVSEPSQYGAGKSGICSVSLMDVEGGPALLFKVQSYIVKSGIKNSTVNTPHEPEIFLSGFTSKMGTLTSNLLSHAMANQAPNFKGRKVMTLMNKRDFIFFRLHRYIFDKAGDTNMAEIGPRFTLRLLRVFSTHDTSQTPVWEYCRRGSLKNSKTHFVM